MNKWRKLDEKKFLLAWDKFFHGIHLRQPGFIYSACKLIFKTRKKIRRSNETGDSRYIYEIEIDKACFLHDMAYADFKDISTRTASDKAILDKAFNIAKNGFASITYNFFMKSLLQINLLLQLTQEQDFILILRTKN